MLPKLTQADLKKSITGEHPDLILVSPLLFQRVVRQHFLQTEGQRVHVPNREFFAFEREHLLKIVSAGELGLSREELPEELLLLQLPSEDTLSEQSSRDVLFGMWRLIFQARIHRTLEKAFESGKLTKQEIHQHIHDIGRSAFSEICEVITQEDFLFPEPDIVEEYITFAAYFLQLRYFAPKLISLTFPSIEDKELAEGVLETHLDPRALLGRSRPKGAPSRESKETETRELFEEAPQLVGPPAPEEEVLSVECPARVQAFLQKGNYLRATLAARKHLQSEKEESEGPDVLDHIFRKIGLSLHDAIGERSPDAALWHQALSPLTEHMRFGFASAAGRLLYELQKLCQEQKRELYKIDLVDWAFSLGRRPIRRDFSDLREVLYCRYLRHALKMLANVQLNHWQHKRLKSCLQEALHLAEERLREGFRPAFISLFEKIALTPQNLPEKIAMKKLIDELLDKVVARGFFTMSELRDGIARNNLKLGDLHSPIELATGDTLLLADRVLHTEHPGIYRRGEIYLRGLQRISSVFFGNIIGRSLSLWLLLPMLASFVTLEGLQHLLNLFAKKLLGHPLHLLNNYTFAALSVLYLGVINNAAVRKYTLAFLSGLWRTLRFLLAELPKKITQLPIMVEFRKSNFYYFTAEYVFKPAFWMLFIMGPLLLFNLTWKTWNISAGLLLVSLSIFLNSSLGRSVHEFGFDHLTRLWQRIRYKVLPGLIRWIIDLFKTILQGMDSVIYRVDEWLRFRAEENPLSVIFKAIFGVFWFFLTYLVRIYITLLIEPQVNPIKHFPVVTVSHKIILPMTKPLTLFFAALLQPFLGTILAGTFAGMTVVLLPGVFGFLAWELKENWRLYVANRSKQLKPILVGSHGENVVRLLRPGFHSGTIPKLYAKLRNYERRIFDQGLVASKHQHQKELHHIEEDLTHFVQREFLKLLEVSEQWTHPLTMGNIHISTNHIELQIIPESAPDSSIFIHFEERSHWLIARLEAGAWLSNLPSKEREVFLVALAGLYKLSGVEMVHEEIWTLLGEKTRYDFSEEGLIVWPDGDYKYTYTYQISDEESLQPIALDEVASTPPAPLKTNDLIFSQRPVTWDAWVSYWTDPSSDSTILSDFQGILRLSPATDHESKPHLRTRS